VSVLDGPRDAELVARSHPLRLHGIPVLVLSALDQLVLALALRDQEDRRSRLLWAADAALILSRRGGHIGPPRLESAQVINLEAVLARARDLDLEPAAAEGWRLLRNDYGLAELLPS